LSWVPKRGNENKVSHLGGTSLERTRELNQADIKSKQIGRANKQNFRHQTEDFRERRESNTRNKSRNGKKWHRQMGNRKRLKKTTTDS
jgi:hypothetical protein